MNRRKLTHYQLAVEHAQRIQRKVAKIEGLEDLLATWEAAGNHEEVTRLTVKLRTVRQELRYMTK
jgi:hypothetical protein